MAGHGGRGGRGGRGRGGHEEEHENHERWLVTYADMVTLLMVLFIVMFAMSQVDERKFNALKAGLAAGFGQSTSIQDGSESILDNTGALPAPMMSGQTLTAAQQAAVDQAVSQAELQRTQRIYAEAEAEAARLDEVRERLEAALAAQGLEDDVVTSIDDRGLVVSLVSRHVVFEADLATLSPRGREIVTTLAPVLADLPDPLEVSGHTNQVPVKPRYFATDWDLSSARALTVLRYLEEQGGIAGERLRSSAYGHERPLLDPDEPGSQEVNKRVDIVVLSSLGGTSRELLEEVAGAAGSPADAPTDTPATAETQQTSTAAEGATP